jgi:LmbE family N-acetylglucosaminyl deacetylase
MVKNVLVIAAHSDDEALGCAGTMAKHIAAGDKVHVIFMTNGVSSRSDTSNSDIENRQTAAQKSADILGITSMEHFGFPDNKMDTTPLLDIIKSIENVINKLQPEIIYTHHIGDLNIDHQITHKAALTACRPQPGFCVKEIYAFEVLSSTEWQIPEYLPFTPNVYIDVSNQIEIKRKSLEAYSDEMHNPPHSRSFDNMLNLSSFRGNSIGVNYAEAFILLRYIK